jgi:two-component system, OmpR family, alkaline phosphatase synthesis response regulator PhoP
MKILIVEDDMYTRIGLVEVFENEEYEVVSAQNGKEALDIFSRESPDFICLDIMMPGMDGYTVCREIRKRDRDVPVLFISAKSEEIDKVVGLELGADDYIVKPFGVKEVLARVKAISRRCIKKSAEQHETFIMNDIRIVPDELQAYRGDSAIELSPRDVKLLCLFASNRGKVVSRNDLFDTGWGLNYIPNSRSLDQYISQLRKKIEKNPGRPEIIVTVPTAGYKYP